MKHSVAIVGGSGYTGALLAELLLRHPSLELTHITSDVHAGTPVSAVLPRVRTGLAFSAHESALQADAAFLCLPAQAAAPIAKQLLDDGTAVVDLSPDFRLTAADYEAWYGEHPHPDMLPGVYGLTELHREEIAGARLVGNPGCYPTAALLALSPLRALGLQDVIVDAKSGVSGAGKAATERTHFCSVDSDLVAYAVGGHRHYPEIAAGLLSDGRAPSLVFVPHLAPLQRGILATIYARVSDLPTAAQLRDLLQEAYADEVFVEVCDQPPQLKDVAGTNYCRIFASVDERSGRVLLLSAIDNLMKGAVGQALQNLNVMLGIREQEGLD